jgi:hypothetical protein
MSAATKDFMQILHNELAKALADKVKSGEATAADLSVARQFLKDNGIDCVATDKNPLGDLRDALPEFGEDDEDTLRH